MEVYTKNNNMIEILKGTGISLIFTLISLLILSITLTYTNLSENFIGPAIIVITAISILIGSSIGNLRIKKNGILNGAIIGVLYLLFIYILSSILLGDFAFNRQSIIMILVGIFFGVLGGIIGVNKK